MFRKMILDMTWFQSCLVFSFSASINVDSVWHPVKDYIELKVVYGFEVGFVAPIVGHIC